jgi:dihydrofolate reductase
MKNITIIAAIGKNRELGKDNDLIWHLPNDLKFSKEVTTDHTIIMGRNTFDSLPKMLLNRKHIVLTSREGLPKEVEVYKELKQILDKYKDIKEEIFIIGGASIYEQFLDYSDKLYLTEIDAEEEASVYFPNFKRENYERQILKENQDNGISYKHVLYIKK